jgi:hypothetical protein
MATFAISNWKTLEKNTLRGFFTVTMPSGLILHNCSLHIKNASRWIGLPSQKYEKNGVANYTPMVEFATREAGDKFRDLVMDALDEAGHLTSGSAASEAF